MPADSLVPKGRLFGCFFATYLEIYWLVNTKSDAIGPTDLHRLALAYGQRAEEVYQIVCGMVVAVRHDGRGPPVASQRHIEPRRGCRAFLSIPPTALACEVHAFME